MDVFLFIVGVVIILIAIGLLIVKLFTKEPKKKMLMLLAVGFAFLMTGPAIGISKMSPEKKLAIKEEILAENEVKLEEKRIKKEKEQLADEEKAYAVEAEEKLLMEKEALEQKEKAEEQAIEGKTDAEKSVKEKTPKVTVEKKAEEEKNNSVPSKSRIVIYDVFKSGDDKINETITSIDFDEDEKVLTLIVKGKDGLSEKLIGRGFYEDSTDVYRELSNDARIKEVWLTITFPMKDTFGNVKDEEVMATWLSRETMDKVNWKNFDYANLLDIVDGVRIYPQFEQ